MTNTIEVVSVGIEAEKDSGTGTEVGIEVYHAFLFAHIIGMTKLVNFHDEEMRAEINEDIWTVAGTTSLHGLVTAEGEGILEMCLERIHDVVLFETETTGNGVIGMEDAVTAETVGLPARFGGDHDIATVLAGDFWVTDDTIISHFLMDTYGCAFTGNTH
jgi:hypothetical protein